MTPLQFETAYSEEWAELERLLAQLESRKKSASAAERFDADQFARLYRRACEQLALVRTRDYPSHLLDRLSALTSRGHQAIYYRSDFGLRRLRRWFLVDFPASVRAQSGYIWVATALFGLPTAILGMLTFLNPDLILSVVDADTAAEFDRMYSDSGEAIGRLRDADNDWVMFGYYIMNNIGIAFQCYATGLFFSVGSLFFLAYNGAFGGAIGGYLVSRGLGHTFFPFVATHSAFELTAIVIAGAAGVRLGHSLLAPGRHTRLQSLLAAARETAVLIYGVIAMLVLAALLEAFWSSARWVPSAAKFTAAALCWVLVLAYFTFQGRPRPSAERP
jgi:uncharacterized membrane protein SpoIIM required for sporulation